MSKSAYNKNHKINHLPRLCKECSIEFIPQRSISYFCSKKCQAKANWKRNKDKPYSNQCHKIRRKAALSMYGKVCECCGEKREEFLTIDHINGNGSQHRKKLGGSSSAVYRDIIKEYKPNLYRILCMNCNFSIGIHGYCPHQQERVEI